MNGLKLKIALLIIGAIIPMTILSMFAAHRLTLHAALEARPDDILSMIWTPAGISLGLVIIGCTVLVGIVVANMVTRPLWILKDTIETVNPEGFIPRLSEKGVGEDLATVRLVNQLSERLREAVESRMRLVAAAGHDLRTPMTRMRLRLEFMEDEAEKSLWERDINEIVDIAESAIRLVKEEGISTEYDVIQLNELIDTLAIELREIGHDVDVLRNTPADVLGGYHSLKRALSNLIENAATYGGSAEVHVTTFENSAYVSIFDNGPGIPDELIDKAFEPFFRVNRSRDKTGKGAGLGLAISKEIVTRHNGKIKLTNLKKSPGLSQVVTLPLHRQ